MEFDDVFDMVLALIDDYHLGFDGNGMPCVTQPNNPHYEDNLTYLRMKMQVLINMVIVKAQIPDLTFELASVTSTVYSSAKIRISVLMS